MASAMLNGVRRASGPLMLFVLLATCPGCRQGNNAADLPRANPRVLVVAPVLNLTGAEQLEPLRLTDLIASEFLSFEGVAVVPVNMALAELEQRGKRSVETPEDARELAAALGADATVVTAVTEYYPYHPPIVGLVMQWYPSRVEAGGRQFNPVAASRLAADAGIELSDTGGGGPRWQLQRVFNAADEEVLEGIRSFASRRGGGGSPYGWRKYTRSQELYVRYCGWAMIRTMLMLDEIERVTSKPNEAKS